MSYLNIGVNCEKVISIKKDIASSMQEQSDKNNGVFIPTGFVPGKQHFSQSTMAMLRLIHRMGKNNFMVL